MKHTLFILFLLTGIKTFAQADTLTAEQAKTMINKEVIVKASFASSSVIDLFKFIQNMFMKTYGNFVDIVSKKNDRRHGSVVPELLSS